MPNGEQQSSPVSQMNQRIASLLREAQPEDIVEILSGPDPSLLRMSQQQQQQQQQVRRPGAAAVE